MSNNLPPPPPPPNSQGGPAPPVGFGPGSSPLAQVRPHPPSRTGTPNAPSPAPADPRAGSRSPFAGQPAPYRPGARPGLPPQPPAAGRATSPLAYGTGPANPYPAGPTGASMLPPPPPPPSAGFASPQRPMAPPAPHQYPQQQPQQVLQPASVPQAMASPPAPQPGSTSSRRRLYPEQMASAYTSQQQQQQQNQFTPAGLPPLPGSVQHGGAQPPVDQGAGPSGFFVPGAASAAPAPGLPPVPPAPNMAAPGYPSTQQSPAAPGVQMAGITQQFSQMGLGPNPQEYQIALLGGKPPLAALDEEPPVIKLPPNVACVPSPHIVCPPRHKRSTLNAVPKTDKLLRKTKLPFGLVITPFKTQEQGEEPLPVANEIVRCRRCRTYINPFVQFVEGGRRWKCNMCSLNNDVPLFFDYDSATQTQKDRWKRPDLNHAVVEFIAPVEYMVRPPMPPVYVFVIDVSYPAVQLGMPGAIGQSILDTLDRIPNVDKRTKVAFIAADTSLHFFQVRPGSAEPQQLVVGDLDDVFLPSPSDLLLNLSECREGIECLLSRLGSMFKDNHSVGNALCPAITAAQKLLGTLGGKVVIMQASPPTIGEGKVDPRPEGKDLGTPRESELLRPQNNWYKTLAAECSRVQIAFDTIFFGQQPMDIPTVSCLARYTGGSVFHYPSFMATRKPEVERFTREFSNHIAAKVGLEAVLRIRASKGLRMASYYGNFFLRSMDLLALPNVTPNHSYAVDVEIDDTITTPVVYFQTALLHTTSYGERRIRVSTLALPTTDNIHTVFHHADQSLLPHGVYLLHDGFDTFLWFGRDVSPAICQALLNVQDLRAVPSGVISLPDLSNGSDKPAPGFELNFRANSIIRRLNALCHSLWNPVTYVCKEEGEPVLRMWMIQRLTEDMDTSAPSYQQFLGQLRDKINRGNF
ncbi:COPII subunit [Dipsacomyces acuminosporus]|nr:COPII subunit [Dipsacomyces acuminosporus]